MFTWEETENCPSKIVNLGLKLETDLCRCLHSCICDQPILKIKANVIDKGSLSPFLMDLWKEIILYWPVRMSSFVLTHLAKSEGSISQIQEIDHLVKVRRLGEQALKNSLKWVEYPLWFVHWSGRHLTMPWISEQDQGLKIAFSLGYSCSPWVSKEPPVGERELNTQVIGGNWETERKEKGLTGVEEVE